MRQGSLVPHLPPPRKHGPALLSASLQHWLAGANPPRFLVLHLPAAGCADKQVGIVWNYFWFEPKRSSWWTPFYLPWIRWGCREWAA